MREPPGVAWPVNSPLPNSSTSTNLADTLPARLARRVIYAATTTPTRTGHRARQRNQPDPLTNPALLIKCGLQPRVAPGPLRDLAALRASPPLMRNGCTRSMIAMTFVTGPLGHPADH